MTHFLRPHDPWCHGEPRLVDVMEDPIVLAVMERDGLIPDEVWPLMLEARSRLGRRLCKVVTLAA
ncbi:hypothetical protein H261_17428 [Paramagnetospirillum caucaseum]|uniref:Uncharacterized protein n=1 Tax=Paramagnetospirillum caucaseum TaxID=1244869 RepID=M3A7A1_9PROT|nr:hypothetical protein [Paramagnetospirillum caucaseum]EME68648.1 hypothetical protein H261_17428 [Paramagnetospirillum caucaseum]